jgi:hypothetical protein
MGVFMFLPKIETILPELTQFTRQLARSYQRGEIQDWKNFIEQVRAFYTPAVMEKIERVSPGWIKMASYANQQTLIHMTSVFVALFLLPEYQHAGPEQQALMEWMELFHDIAKEAQPEIHDYIHGFRSAAVAGKALASIGFPLTPSYSAHIDEWAALTHNATVFDVAHNEMIQDNRKLPDIMAGIDLLYGSETPATLAIKAILLHLSLDIDPDYPTLAPLTDLEAKHYIDKLLSPYLKVLLLVDGDAWNLFDREAKQRSRVQTLAFFEEMDTSFV